MKRFAIAIALTSIFAGSALAGDIPMVPGPPPPFAAPADNGGDVTNSITDEITDEFVLAIFSMFAR